jgi:hypothetical protein
MFAIHDQESRSAAQNKAKEVVARLKGQAQDRCRAGGAKG